jgi:hypothetical protein
MPLCTGVLISPSPDQEGNKIQRQKILMFLYIYIYIYNKTSMKRNILTIKQNTSNTPVVNVAIALHATQDISPLLLSTPESRQLGQ